MRDERFSDDRVGNVEDGDGEGDEDGYVEEPGDDVENR